jgi:hypothetical protein
LSAEKAIHVFRCGTSGLYALTNDRNGSILPAAVCCPAGWEFQRTIALPPLTALRKSELVRATVSAIESQGYYLSHAAIGGLPLDILDHQPGNAAHPIFVRRLAPTA